MTEEVRRTGGFQEEWLSATGLFVASVLKPVHVRV